MGTANSEFVHDHIGPNWLAFNRLDIWPGHNADIRLAASSAGLRVERHDKLMLFFSGSQCVASQSGMVTSLVSGTAVSVARDKTPTKHILKSAGIPVPNGLSVAPSDREDAMRLVGEDSGPWVIKPSDARAGAGITTGVTCVDQVEEAWLKAKVALSRGAAPIIIEEEIDGVDLRIFVVAGRAVSAAVRLPAFVIGDGEATLDRLLIQLVEARSVNAYIKPKTIDIDARVLSRQGLEKRQDVPEDGQVVFLNSTANIHKGGVSVEVSDLVAPDMLRLAEVACEAIPGLAVAGVDLLAPDITSLHGVKVIEMNTSANSAINQYPAFGAGRDVTSAIVAAMIFQRTGTHSPHGDPAVRDRKDRRAPSGGTST